MIETRVEDLPDGGVFEVDDRFNLQRQEGAVWNDYQVSFARYFGEVNMGVFAWDMSVPFLDVIYCPAGKNLLLLGAWATFTPGGSPTAGTVLVQFVQGSNTNSMVIEFVDGAVGSARTAVVLSDPSDVPWFDLYQQDVQFSEPNGGYSGTGRIYVQYVTFDPA